MKKSFKEIKLEEQLNRMKYLNSLGNISEATYSLTSQMDEDDEMPEDAILNNDEENPEQENNDQESMGDENPEQGGDENSEQGGDEIPSEPPVDNEPQPMTDQTAPPNIEDVQNRILKSSVSAMQDMASQIGNFEIQISRMSDIINQYENRINHLSNDVEEVREPSNVEKLDKRKEDSYPYSFNLKNMWSDKINDNNASGKVQDENIVELEDGSYIANYDSLPKFTEEEIEKSFNR